VQPPVRGLAVLVQLAVPELGAVARADTDEKPETNRAAVVPSPDDTVVLVVLEQRRLVGLAGLTHLGHPEDSAVEREIG
jgi:hypothetical protein